MVKVLGKTFSIKERKIKTQGRRFTKLKLTVTRIYFRLTRLTHCSRNDSLVSQNIK